MSNQQLTPIQEKLINFFSPVEIDSIRRHLKEVFKVAAFESEIAKNDGGQNALYTLYHIIEILEDNN